MIEKWKDVLGYEGLYQISSLGRVKRIARKDFAGHSVPEIILKNMITKDGYPTVDLVKNRKRKHANIHRLVAMNFIDNPLNLRQVNHIDEDKSNNSVDNLEWCTPEYNVNYGTRTFRAFKNKRNNPVVGINLKTGLKIWFKNAELSKYYGFSPSCISQCINGKRNKHKGYTWVAEKERGKVI